jgi:hypothetical protein
VASRQGAGEPARSGGVCAIIALMARYKYDKVRPARGVDPYADVDVIDARAPRFNQGTVALLGLVAIVSGWWWLIALLALQLIVGLTLGRRYCLPCVFYFEVVQPRWGEGEIEDSRPPRFANILGAVVLSASALAHALGLSGLGDALALVVVFLASLAAITGLCVGCELYRVLARLRGIRPGGLQRLDPDDLGASISERTVVQFTHPLCTGCRTVARRLADEGRDVVLIDVSKRSDLAKRYGITVVPTALAVGGDGRVLERLA